MFKKAKANSPAKSCDIVIANAGVSGPDEIFASSGLEGKSEHTWLTSLTKVAATEDPTKPELRILNINLTGVLYTTKIAMNYFRLQPEDPDRDRCFIFKGSIAGLLDQPGSWQYSTSKFGLRGLMRSMRHTTWQSGIRVNYVGPCAFILRVIYLC
jgi:NAD(P)-dependent dehydrogenase (short-subunit alcohol dehydrogenase family)